MTISFAKSLDRPVDVFGIKGRWLGIFIALVGVSVVLAIIVGSVVSSGTGVCVAILLAVASFVFCLMMQGRVPARQVSKYRASVKIYPFVARHESLCRILLSRGSDGRCWFYKRYVSDCSDTAATKEEDR